MLKSPLSSPIKRTLRSAFTPSGGYAPAGYDTDAQAYITAVETADSASLETGVKDAINSFVVYCKAQGIWTAIKASCILAGARTLSGALVPLKGTAPTNFNFVSGDYNRKTGLIGNGTTKYLNSNRLDSTDPLNNYHVSAYATRLIGSSGGFLLGTGFLNSGDTQLETDTRTRSRTGTLKGTFLATRTSPFLGLSRSSSENYTSRSENANVLITQHSITSMNVNYFIFASNNTGSPQFLTHERIAFYSIGEAIDLAKLQTAVTNLMTAISTAF
jgi:hypothetical protein